MRLVLTTITPPGRTADSNFSSDGRLSTMRACGLRVIGEPTGLSDSTTVQLHVPPRISGPYAGIQVTSLPAFIPAYASSLPISSTP